MIQVTNMDGSTTNITDFVNQVKNTEVDASYQSADEAFADLDKMYEDGARMVQQQSRNVNAQANIAFEEQALINFPRIGRLAMKKIQDALCENGQPDPTVNDIVTTIVETLVGLIPLGTLAKPIIKKLADWIIAKTLNNFCAWVIEDPIEDPLAQLG